MEQNAHSIIFFGIAATFCIVYSAYQYISFMMNKELISYAIATIIDTKTIVPETMKKNNSKWATVSFRVNRKEYVPSNRIQVSMNASVGDQIKIAYYKENPSELFTSSLKKASIFFMIGVLCIAIIFYF
ncbi:hypothetical protein [Haloimpatiens massiliensis]|uniref:hypothetical protein n=1 Tax=Haloimpatiens massiliensis TaxID=1658110 RepID=UPI000C84325A|nr:hypothetical protein [Haloimpatiens massiliensis]